MYMCGAHALTLTSQTLDSSFQNTIQVSLQRAMTDPANGQKFTSSEPLTGNKECPEKRERQERTRLLHALLEREMNHG